MVPFTLYCFAKLFHLSYSGSTPKLLNLFEAGTSSEALTKVVSGRTDSMPYAERIDLNRPQAQNTLRTLRDDRLHFAYRQILGKDPGQLPKEALVSELLSYALLREKEEQASVYQGRSNAEVRDLIEQLRNLSAPDYTPETEPQEPAAQASQTEQTAAAGGQDSMTTNVFFEYVEQHFDEIASLEIACHAGDIWLRPSSYRYRLLKRLCEKQIPIRVIINTSAATAGLWQHMRDMEAFEMGMYRSLEDITHAWEVISSSRDNICVKTCNIPLLHSYIRFSYRSDITTYMRIGLYTYGKIMDRSQPHLYITEQDLHYVVMLREFSYLWEHSEPLA